MSEVLQLFSEADRTAIQKASRLLDALDHPLRQKILQLFFVQESMTVTEIQLSLNLEQSATSAQLGILRRAQLVNVEIDKKFRRYRLHYDAIAAIKMHTSELTK
jgi:predicted transcriptional regulator